MSKDNKLKARLPRGFADRGAADLAATHRMLEAIRETYELYGFEAIETPFVEYTDALGKFLPDQDRPNEGVFSFQDDDEQWLSLRYDLTAPLARYVAENFDALPKPYRSFRAGWVFRNEKPGPGRFRQFMQFDADTVGAASVAADAEICMMAADTLERVGIARGDYVIKVNNRKVLDGVMEAIGLGGEENAGRRLTVMRALDKFDRLGWEGVEALLGAGRRDESGDFTKGANLSHDQILSVISVFVRSSANERFRRFSETITKYAKPIGSFKKTLGGPGDKLGLKKLLEEFFFLPDVTEGRFSKTAGDSVTYELFDNSGNLSLEVENARVISVLRSDFRDSKLYQEGVSELEEIAELADKSGYGSRRILIDPSVVRGLEYYTGPVYEAELTFEVTNEDGQPVRFGSVGGGGRYDGLVGRFRNEPVPATGFSIGVSRLLAALKAIDSPIVRKGPDVRPLVVVSVMDRERVGDYQRMVTELRGLRGSNGKPLLRAEMYLGEGRFGAQMKYADRRGAGFVVIQGSDEKAKGEVQIKDLAVGAELAAIAKDDRDAYLRKQAEAQVSVPEARLGDKLREMLARHAPA